MCPVDIYFDENGVYLLDFISEGASICSDLSSVEEEERCKPQSGVVKINSDGKEENIVFAGGVGEFKNDLSAPYDETRSLTDTYDTSLANYFRRPIQAISYSWGVGQHLYTQLDPWDAFFKNARVVNRLTSFNLLRAKLHVKIIINGNGMYHGRAMAIYHPFANKDTLTRNSELINRDLVQMSQMPHIFLNPTTSMGGEMVLPYFDYRNNMSISDSSWSDLGRLTIRSLNALRHANGASDPITVTVFVWAEDVVVSGLTTVDSNSVQPQSGKEVDEANLKGFISGPATAIAKASGALKGVPGIGKYAAATEMGAKMVASGAKALGYSRPVVTSTPDQYTPHPISSLSLTTVTDTLSKLTVDDKQELTIDPGTVGLKSNDPMIIKDIASIESYLTSFTWNIADSPNKLLWNCRVDPCVWAQDNLQPSGFLFPACAMAALPFKYWTGSMKFRFQIASSNFHKGRLRVVYDPNYIATKEYNTNHMAIVDIGNETDFTIKVENGQPTTLLDHALPGRDSVLEMYNDNEGGFTSKRPGNGVIGVYVMNELTTPNDTSSFIEVNVFVSMGDDFEVFVPTSYFQKFLPKPSVLPQMGSAISDEIVKNLANETSDQGIFRTHQKSSPPPGMGYPGTRTNVHVRSDPRRRDRSPDTVYQTQSRTDIRDTDEYSHHVSIENVNFNGSRIESLILSRLRCLEEELTEVRKMTHSVNSKLGEVLSQIRRTHVPLRDRMSPQSGIEGATPYAEEDVDAPEQVTSIDMGSSASNHRLLNKLFTGESIASFRTLLKRYNLHTSFLHYAGGGARSFHGKHHMFPYMRGQVAGAIHKRTGGGDAGTPYNFCNTLLLHWVVMAHSGWRGGIRYKLIPRGRMDSAFGINGYVSLADTESDSAAYDLSNPPVAYTSNSVVASSSIKSESFVPDIDTPPSGVRGAAYFTGSINPVIPFEIPYYSKYRFEPGKASNYTSSVGDNAWTYHIRFPGGGDSTYDKWVAASEDFQVFMFTGLPPLYFEESPPAAL